MDFSVYYPSILFMYFVAFATVIVFAVFSIYGDMFLMKKYFRSRLVFDLILLVVCISFTVGVLFFSLAFFKDIPNVVAENYVIKTGTAVGGDSGGQDNETRGFAFKIDDGEILKLVVNYTPVYRGDRFKVIYLPNTEIGAIMKKLQTNIK